MVTMTWQETARMGLFSEVSYFVPAAVVFGMLLEKWTLVLRVVRVNILPHAILENVFVATHSLYKLVLGVEMI